ncbi:AAA family ATPase [Alicyclobacillus dauci]|uniref:AAA family ATPase n=1 Tax=Alicyclobacillus dauci TaxID=1475485 RepID=A0ABY6Z1V1_9BACL|nr:AAA family ATPase [Alicyclobacillus dauci]WAH36483.1 AAA family ATPase [Alicyclobacillus dauci]
MNDFTFLVTKEYRRFEEFCDACRRYRYIGLCYGPPGVGKTLSARKYANWEAIEDLLELKFVRGSKGIVPDASIVDPRAIFYTAPVMGSPNRISKEIGHIRSKFKLGLEWVRAFRAGDEENYANCTDPTELIIVDEADRLKITGLEEIRDIYDRSQIGLILIGMPGIEKRLLRYPQLYSRVGFVHEFRTLNVEELRFILEHKWRDLGLQLQPENYFGDAEALSAITRITGGNFRLVHRLFTQIERVMEINELKNITKEVVETARSNLVIGAGF